MATFELSLDLGCGSLKITSSHVGMTERVDPFGPVFHCGADRIRTTHYHASEHDLPVDGTYDNTFVDLMMTHSWSNKEAQVVL